VLVGVLGDEDETDQGDDMIKLFDELDVVVEVEEVLSEARRGRVTSPRRLRTDPHPCRVPPKGGARRHATCLALQLLHPHLDIHR
jgi:hypothetical protein